MSDDALVTTRPVHPPPCGQLLLRRVVEFPNPSLDGLEFGTTVVIEEVERCVSHFLLICHAGFKWFSLKTKRGMWGVLANWPKLAPTLAKSPYSPLCDTFLFHGQLLANWPAPALSISHRSTPFRSIPFHSIPLPSLQMKKTRTQKRHTYTSNRCLPTLTEISILVCRTEACGERGQSALFAKWVERWKAEGQRATQRGAHGIERLKKERAVVENQSPVKVVARTTLLWCCVCGVG